MDFNTNKLECIIQSIQQNLTSHIVFVGSSYCKYKREHFSILRFVLLSCCRQTMSLKGDQGLWCWSTVLILVIWLCFSIFIEFISVFISYRVYQNMCKFNIQLTFNDSRLLYMYLLYYLMQEQAVGNYANKDYLSMLDKLANYA